MKTKEELDKRKAVETLNNKHHEINEDELKQVTGGTDSVLNYISEDEGYDNITYTSSISAFYEECKPEVISAMLPHEGRMLEGQVASCSDPIRKGTKPECQKCSANK